MGSASVWIAGSYQSDYARNYAREGLEISDMIAEAVAGTLDNAGVNPQDVQAIWIGHEGQDAKFMWPYMFSALADEYDRRYGLDTRHLHAIAELNMRNAKGNPLAQTRGWTFGPGSFADDNTDNPIVEGRLRRTDCSQVTDGTAGVLLVSDRFRSGKGPRARIAG
jgi:hypothetical protein